MKKITLLLFFSTAMLCLNPSAAASSCATFEQHIERLNKYRRAGGSNKQMNRWQQQRRDYSNKLAECIRSQRNHHIQSTTPSRDNTYYDYWRPLHSKNTAPAIIKLFETCNFWIKEHNRLKNRDSADQRNYACRTAQNAEREYRPNKDTPYRPTRTLKECIKANNLIDNDVNDCMLGIKEPTGISE